MAGNTLQAQATWVEGLQLVASGEASGIALVLDGKKEDGGTESGVRPMEALLLSLAGCTGMDVVSVLKKKRQHVTGFRINLLGTRAEEHPRRYLRIQLEYIVRGWNVSEEAVARAIELSMTKYCSVRATLNCEVVYTQRVEQEQAEPSL
jgi:putative redox protein